MKNPETAPSIVVEGLHDSAFTDRVRAKILETLQRVDPPPTTARIIFADENGPKGGVDTRCTIVSEMPRRREIAVSEVGPTLEVAFDAAYDAFAVSVGRDRTRRRALVRRPKKYFLAKRLLDPGTTLDPTPAAPEAPTRAKRMRRRRAA